MPLTWWQWYHCSEEEIHSAMVNAHHMRKRIAELERKINWLSAEPVKIRHFKVHKERLEMSLDAVITKFGLTPEQCSDGDGSDGDGIDGGGSNGVADNATTV